MYWLEISIQVSNQIKKYIKKETDSRYDEFMLIIQVIKDY